MPILGTCAGMMLLADRVVDGAAGAVGADVEVLARVTGGDAVGRIVAVRRGPLLATSFHPEVEDDLRIHRLFLDLVQT